MLDGEDAIAPGDDVADRASAVAAETLAEADWGAARSCDSLRFYRPPGFNLETTARDLYTLLWRLRERVPSGPFPLDGIVFPKVEHPEEVDLRRRHPDSRGDRPRPRPTVDPGRAADRIRAGRPRSSPEIAGRAAPRLASLIFGVADYSADLGLPAIGNDHLLADWARAEIIAVAGGVGVPAIDGMTLDYPVADPALDAAANRTRWLDRMRLVYDDTVRARELGMLGKWVGHPAQLFAVMLAYETGLTDEALEHEAAKLEAYGSAVAADQGATMIAGVMSDRATDRHARVVLRQATALGRFDPIRALASGVIDRAELDGACWAPAPERQGAGAMSERRTRLGRPVPRGLRGR